MRAARAPVGVVWTEDWKGANETATGYRSEFRYGAFTRTLPLPEGCTEADVTATYHDGILEVRVPTSPATSSTAAKVAITRT